LKACARPACPNDDAARRLAAILAVDFVGYSRLMDEAVTARRFANIARHKMFPTRSL
jgi:hypothetical protein